jgi:hypothetical protein
MIDALIAHLKCSTQSFKRISHAKDQQPVDDVLEELPFLGVFPGEDTTNADDSRTDYIESKMVTSVALVHLVCDIEDFESLRTELRTAVIGWNAGPYHTDTTLMSGNLISLKGGVIWWEEKYSSRHLVRATY